MICSLQLTLDPWEAGGQYVTSGSSTTISLGNGQQTHKVKAQIEDVLRELCVCPSVYEAAAEEPHVRYSFASSVTDHQQGHVLCWLQLLASLAQCNSC
jgi:hypothetical protein